jgi:membrane protease YdiL (CAAX protease family)
LQGVISTTPEVLIGRRVLRNEVLLVLGVSLVASAVRSLLRIIDLLTRDVPLAQQTARMNVAQTPDRPWLDLAFQLAGIAIAVVPVLLALHLLNRHPGDGIRLIGIDPHRRRFDLTTGVGLAALIGIPGLLLYVIALEFGVNVTIAPANLEAVWWAAPVLVLAAAQNALLEEVVGVGYLLTRLRELGWHTSAAIGVHALLRGSYHLYQGLGGFIGNAVMGVVFALFFLRFRRVMPLVVAHTLLDVVAFVGYATFREEIDSAVSTLRDLLPGR